MMVQSPLKRHEVKPNLRKVPKPDIAPSPSQAKKLKKQKVRKKTPSGSGSLPKLKPGNIILITLLLGAFGFMYLTHVFATQKLLQEVQELEREYNKTRQIHDELKLQYDRMIGPAEIYEKAKEQGFVNGGPVDKVIIVKE